MGGVGPCMGEHEAGVGEGVGAAEGSQQSHGGRLRQLAQQQGLVDPGHDPGLEHLPETGHDHHHLRYQAGLRQAPLPRGQPVGRGAPLQAHAGDLVRADAEGVREPRDVDVGLRDRGAHHHHAGWGGAGGDIVDEGLPVTPKRGGRCAADPADQEKDGDDDEDRGGPADGRPARRGRVDGCFVLRDVGRRHHASGRGASHGGSPMARRCHRAVPVPRCRVCRGAVLESRRHRCPAR